MFETDRICDTIEVITPDDGVKGICRATLDERDSRGDVETEKGVFETLTRLVLMGTVVSLKNGDLLLLIVLDLTIDDKVALLLA